MFLSYSLQNVARSRGIHLQIVDRPEDLSELSQQLTVRHAKASRLQISRLDTAFRAFHSVRQLEDSKAQEAALRQQIQDYFHQQPVSSETEGEGQDKEDLQGLPLRPAEPLLGADCRALVAQLQKSPATVRSPIFEKGFVCQDLLYMMLHAVVKLDNILRRHAEELTSLWYRKSSEVLSTFRLHDALL